MKNGLKKILWFELNQRGVLSYDEAEQITRDCGYKIDNMTRRLRELIETGVIEPIRNEKRIITAYRYCGEEKTKVQIMQFNQGNLCLK